eukprot:Plantae.Rhodophyta-Hildenbrandia_rubra.ctg21057.p1 GENE.Plantae.Rhodophyta-Hildenbrandia_rubra.ctg21057~~Plantae.Rhodophyta-Hildenbrandia_rubra.ctg21057.p1  ORF type:complete len:702 (-),score=123.08 Plantae.Rhodophyta-Hildenbrandia_rubra.ctg21057:176-2281(-)
MCGIFGHATFGIPIKLSTALSILLQGLHRLEYRGYDSAGLAIDGPLTSPSPLVIKCVGAVGKLSKAVDEHVQKNTQEVERVVQSHVGIAHTRWATHGAPSEINSHPQSSDDEGMFLVAHNGIITNYKALKRMLESKGFVFESETDTEVIAKLLKYLYESVGDEEGGKLGFEELVMHVMHEIEGAFALLIRSSCYPNELVSCKRGSPLVIGLKPADGEEVKVMSCGNLRDKLRGVGQQNKRRRLMSNGEGRVNAKKNYGDKREIFFSSDASAIIEHTDKVVYMEDNDLAHVDGQGNLKVYNYNEFHTKNIESNRTIATLQLELQQIMKGDYDHFMLKEIFEQPESLTQTMRGRVLEGSADTRMDVCLGGLREHSHLTEMRRSNRIIFVACGTSHNSSVAARQVMEELTEMPVSVEMSSDFIDRQTPLFRSDVCVFVSQSGETADTLSALKYAKKCQALTVGVVNVVGSTIARMTDCGVHLNAGSEIGVASTKVYTSQIVALVMIALEMSADSKSKSDRRRAIFEGLATLSEKVQYILDTVDKQVKGIAKRLVNKSSLLLFGRGYQYATCMEAALKIKEVSYIHTEGIHAGELKHGPLALIDEHMPVIMFANRDSTADKVQNALHQVTARGAKKLMIIVATEGDEEISKFSDKAEILFVPETVDCLQCILSIVPMQMLSYHLAVNKGLNVDQPRNLAKSVTVE